MCGEQSPTTHHWTPEPGSPPRVRGTGSNWGLVTHAARITPACAGNRKVKKLTKRLEKDHPRVCGEQAEGFFVREIGIGSPPRVRGTASPFSIFMRSLRITPACAGNSDQACKPQTRHRDHPRVCGEQAFQTVKLGQTTGSPPRVRGTEHQNFHQQTAKGITPACAGNSNNDNSLHVRGADHPRVCGEQKSNLLSIDKDMGSPPRVRGTG